MRVAPWEVAACRRDHVLGLGLELLGPVPVRPGRLRVTRHLGPGVLHQLVGPAPEEHRPRRVRQARPVPEHLVVGDPFPVVATPVQRHVEREGQESQGADYFSGFISFQAWATHEPAGHYNSRTLRATPTSSAPVVQFWDRCLAGSDDLLPPTGRGQSPPARCAQINSRRTTRYYADRRTVYTAISRRSCATRGSSAGESSARSASSQWRSASARADASAPLRRRIARSSPTSASLRPSCERSRAASSGDAVSSARATTSVRFPSRRSLAVDFPVTSASPNVPSRSSAIWNATPSGRAYADRTSSSARDAPASVAPRWSGSSNA